MGALAVGSRFSNLEMEEAVRAGDGHGAGEVAQGNSGGSGFGVPIQDAEALLGKAADCELNGDFEGGLRNYSAALGENPLLPAAWVGQSWMLLRLDELPEASAWCDKALENYPESPDLLAVKAIAQYRMGNESTARDICDRALQLSGEFPFVWLARGEIMLRRSRAAAEECFTRVIRSADPGGPFALRVASVLVHYSRHAQALPLLRKIVAEMPTAAEGWYLLGTTLSRLGLRGEAVDALDQACSLAEAAPRYSKAKLKAERQGFSLFGLARRLLGAR